MEETSDPLEKFALKHPLILEYAEKTLDWIKDQKILFEAFLVALSLHVMMFPVLWFIGWVLPWPKPPVITTVIEYDLQEWVKTGQPKKITEFRNPDLNK
jgi:hypothetical protein